MLSLEQIDQIEELILEGTRIPFSSGRLVNEQEAVIVLDQLRQSIPNDLTTAKEIINNKNKYIEQAQRDSTEIIRRAKHSRDNLVNRAEVNRESQRQIIEIQQKTKLQCEKLIRKAKEKELLIENNNNIKANNLEKNYQLKQTKLIRDFKDMSEKLESKLIQEHNSLKNELKNEYNHLLEELNDLKKQKAHIQEQINNSIEETQEYCKDLIDQAKLEASSIKKGSFNYVENAFAKLESNLDNIKNEINAGKNYISKIDKKKMNIKK